MRKENADGKRGAYGRQSSHTNTLTEKSRTEISMRLIVL